VTLRQNLHQFQAEENARNAASDKAFSRTGPQNDPLEGGKILFIWLNQMNQINQMNQTNRAYPNSSASPR
jgi:hypothetical protein